MGKSIIIAIDEPATKSIKEKNYGIFDINFNERQTSVTDIIPDAKGFREKSYSIIDIDPEEYASKAISILPFRVKFTSVDLVGYGPNNPAPIGIAIIGTNNYIL